MKNVAWKMDERISGVMPQISGKLDAYVTVALSSPMTQVYDVQDEVIQKVHELMQCYGRGSRMSRIMQFAESEVYRKVDE
tara:strand:+ start:1482 stop:1721 length:240 start_codon:yes stop_codon:yes gene_type:complete